MDFTALRTIEVSKVVNGNCQGFLERIGCEFFVCDDSNY
jgi:hypothetical protein